MDEAWSWAVSRLSPMEIVRVSSTVDPQPPAYYLILKVVQSIFPSNEAGLRSFSALCSIMSLILILVFVKRWWNSRAAFYAGLWITFSSFDLYYAQETRNYTLLGLLWLLDYILMIEAVRGRPRLLVVWGVVNVLISWTHMYGLLAVASQVTFVLVYWIWHRLKKQPSAIGGLWLGLGLAISLVGVFPPLFLLWKHLGIHGGGSWIPAPEDLFYLLSLITSGLAAARVHFLDSSHLVLPALAKFPYWGWWLISLGWSGLFILGIKTAWKAGRNHRWEAILSLLLIFIPLSAGFLVGIIFQKYTWALKSFIGIAYLFYIWIGLGVSRLPKRLYRVMAAVLMSVVALVSLIPYFTIWQKADAARAFSSFPTAINHQDLILLESPSIAPLAYFYLDPTINLWGVGDRSQKPVGLLRVSPVKSLLGDNQLEGCDDPQLKQAANVWLYGVAERMRKISDALPQCFLQKNIWLFDTDKWVRLR
jgi:hypothetical protein